MNTSLVKSAPQGDFAEISVLVQGWEIKFQMLVSQKRPIKYDMYPLPTIPQEFKNRLNQQGYHDLVLENDRWQHFFGSKFKLSRRWSGFAGRWGRSTRSSRSNQNKSTGAYSAASAKPR